MVRRPADSHRLEMAEFNRLNFQPHDYIDERGKTFFKSLLMLGWAGATRIRGRSMMPSNPVRR